jgi:hypothetical protein
MVRWRAGEIEGCNESERAEELREVLVCALEERRKLDWQIASSLHRIWVDELWQYLGFSTFDGLCVTQFGWTGPKARAMIFVYGVFSMYSQDMRDWIMRFDWKVATYLAKRVNPTNFDAWSDLDVLQVIKRAREDGGI